jgi:threonylcarbamoyladenosine tRNA methylthiotransferase MtaB
MNNGLEDLIENILKKTKIPRIRLTSLEPPEVTDRLLDLYTEERLCPHFHMSIQSAQTQVLADMKRKYTQKEVETSLLRINKQVPNVFIGMDVIVGFPTEGDAAFQETYDVLNELPWSKIHVFPYSERVGTRAALIDDSVPMAIRKLRSQKLRELSQRRYEQMALQQVGQFKKVLLLKNRSVGDINLMYEGLSRDYWPVQTQLNSELVANLKKGQEVTVQIKAVASDQQHDLIGSLVL